MAWHCRRPLAFLGCTFILACADGASAPRPVERDSAGIRLVDNITVDALPHWTTSSEPLVEIGAVSGEPVFEFDGIGSVALLGNGTVVVADRGSRQIRAFGRDGAHRWTAGGPGEGPGEFAAEATLFAFRGDSLLAYDFGQRRITVFAGDGRVGRIVSIGHLQPNGELAGAFGDGSLLVSTRHLRSMAPGVNRDSVAWFVCDPDTAGVLREIGASRRRDVVLARVEAMPVMDERPLAATGAGVAVGGTFARTTGEAAELHLTGVSGASGTRRTIARWDVAPQLLDAGTAEHWRAEDMAVRRSEADRFLRERWLEAVTFPDQLPVTERLMAGEARVFAQEFQLPWTRGPRGWLVFDDGGRLLARLETPADVTVHAIRDDVVAGVARDAYDVERVRLYPIIH